MPPSSVCDLDYLSNGNARVLISNRMGAAIRIDLVFYKLVGIKSGDLQNGK